MSKLLKRDHLLDVLRRKQTPRASADFAHPVSAFSPAPAGHRASRLWSTPAGAGLVLVAELMGCFVLALPRRRPAALRHTLIQPAAPLLASSPAQPARVFSPQTAAQEAADASPALRMESAGGALRRRMDWAMDQARLEEVLRVMRMMDAALARAAQACGTGRAKLQS